MESLDTYKKACQLTPWDHRRRCLLPELLHANWDWQTYWQRSQIHQQSQLHQHKGRLHQHNIMERRANMTRNTAAAQPNPHQKTNMDAVTSTQSERRSGQRGSPKNGATAATSEDNTGTCWNLDQGGCYKIRCSLSLDQPVDEGWDEHREYQHKGGCSCLVQKWIGCEPYLRCRPILSWHVLIKGHMYGDYLQYISTPVPSNNGLMIIYLLYIYYVIFIISICQGIIWTFWERHGILGGALDREIGKVWGWKNAGRKPKTIFMVFYHLKLVKLCFYYS
jgi:hypothetical protein